MAKLTAKQRKALPASAFAYPATRKYPIHDKAHARAALSMAARKGTSGSYATVKAKVARKFPSIGKVTTKKTTRRRSTVPVRRTVRRRA